MYAGYDGGGSSSVEIDVSVFSFLDESNLETVLKLRTIHGIKIQDFQSE